VSKETVSQILNSEGNAPESIPQPANMIDRFIFSTSEEQGNETPSSVSWLYTDLSSFVVSYVSTPCLAVFDKD
jgi:hypothetical protein